MGEILSFRDLEAWQLAMDMVELTYRLTADFPDRERFGLTSQMRRAAVSVPSNIAEGHTPRMPRVYLKHVRIALGSVGELDTELEVAERLGYVSTKVTAPLRERLDRTRQTLHGLRRSLERKCGLLVGGPTLSILALSSALLL